MKTIIAGSRSCTDYALLKSVIKKAQAEGLEITEVISGCACGVDSMGEWWAKENNIPCKKFPAEWDKYGKGAGYVRNKQMAEYGEVIIALQKNCSKGTANMIKQAEQLELIIFVEYI